MPHISFKTRISVSSYDLAAMITLVVTLADSKARTSAAALESGRSQNIASQWQILDHRYCSIIASNDNEHHATRANSPVQLERYHCMHPFQLQWAQLKVQMAMTSQLASRQFDSDSSQHSERPVPSAGRPACPAYQDCADLLHAHEQKL